MADPKDPRYNPSLDTSAQEPELTEEQEAELLAEEKVVQSPLLALSHKVFLLTLPDDDVPPSEKLVLRSEILASIQEHKMAPYYHYITKTRPTTGLTLDQALYDSLTADNASELAKLDAAIEDARKNAGDVEVREAQVEKAKFFYRVGDKANALTAYEATLEKAVGAPAKIDVEFALIRLALAFNDVNLLEQHIEICKGLIEQGGDWERKNLFAVYSAVFFMLTRQFDLAADKLINSIATFTNYELMDYEHFIFYTALIALVKIDRVQLKQKIITQPEILSNIDNIPNLRPLVFNLYKCQYAAFFQALADISPQIRRDPYLHAHAPYYMREIRIVAYNQFLASYKSATLESMAAAFGVSAQFMDAELFRFISAGRIHAKIDSVAGVVETIRPDQRNAQYTQLIKEGDQLLNRIQKLTKLISY